MKIATSSRVDSLTDFRQRLLPNWAATMLMAFCMVFSMGHSHATYGQGVDGGQFDGAIWTFSMTPHDRNLERRNGMFRVNGTSLFQRSSMEKPGFDRRVGMKTQIIAVRNRKGKIVGPEKTTLKFFDLHSNGQKYKGIRGEVVLVKDKFGEWSGRFVDANGLHWDFKCSRKQE